MSPKATRGDIVQKIPQDGPPWDRPYGPMPPMPHPPELEALPTAGSLVGRHLIVREIARGTVGPLYLARTQNNDQDTLGAIDTLARVIPLPADLPAKDDQLIAEAIWDSANVGHDMVLRVADVVAGKGWVTLVHDHHLGSLLGSMQRRAGDLGSGFPSEVAARIALDVLEGLEQSRGLCESNRIPWRPGSIAIGSLYLCGDGRTRALDGQVMAAVMRSAHMRALFGTAASVAPEMLDANREPDERTDVFAVGAVLWELLTGREMKLVPEVPIANVVLSVPRGTQVPQGLVYALQRAVELDPAQRQSTLRELAVELVMGAEKVATYEQVIEFASTLLPYEAAFQSMPPDAGRAEAASAPMPALEQSEPRFASPLVAPAAAAASTATPAQKPEPSPQSSPKSHAAAAWDWSPPPKATPVITSAAAARLVPSSIAPATPTPATPAPATPAPAEVSAAAATPAPAAVVPTTDDIKPAAAAGSVESALDSASNPKGARLEQISWPDEDGSPNALANAVVEPAKKSNGAKPAGISRDQLDTMSGPGTSGGLEVAKGSKPSDGDPGVAVSPVIEIRQGPSSARQPEPVAKLARRDSGRPTATAKSTASAAGHGSTKTSSSRPRGAKLGEATTENSALSDEALDILLGKRPKSDVTKKGGLQITPTTLILGFSTTVLAVILVMLLLQHQSRPAAPTAMPVPPVVTRPVEQTVAASPAETAGQPADRGSIQQAAAPVGKPAEAAPTNPTDVKVDRRKQRPAKSGANAATKAGVTVDEAASDDSKAKKPKTYVPNDL
jgi:hypothetical protein